MPKMNPKVKAKWLEALRRGEYTQGEGTLRQGTSRVVKFCCLGVLCDLYDSTQWSESSYWDGEMDETLLPPTVREWSGILNAGKGAYRDENTGRLAEMNDSGVPFAQIADYIEENY